ncbi:MAG TPA: arginase family protein [Prolixibacteraceae bacterium]|nr:arginase family protein [Prolixibacteraceae bacterium]
MKKESVEGLLPFFDPVRKTDFIDQEVFDSVTSSAGTLLVHSEDFRPEPEMRFEVALVFIGPATDASGDPVPGQWIREAFYRLKKVSPVMRIFDLGNMKTGSSFADTLFILEEVCSSLLRMKSKTVFIGQDQELTRGIFNALKEFENNINLVHIDSRIDVAQEGDPPGAPDYLGQIMEQEAAWLYNIAAIGYQSYFTDPKQIKKLDELYFEHYRLGNLRNNLEETEPVLRDADLVSFDLSAVRYSDLPAVKKGSPNGFFAEEACQLARYAGLSDRCNLFALFGEFDPNERQEPSSLFVAQMLWYYLDGILNRKHDYPVSELDDYTKFAVAIDEIEFPIVFYFSEKSKRWWLEVVNPAAPADDPGKVVVACSASDYRKACNNEIPERWWINFKKIR